MVEYSLKKPGIIATDVLLPIFGIVWVVVAPRPFNWVGVLLIGISLFLTARRMSLPYTSITTTLDEIGLVGKDGSVRTIAVKDLAEVIEQSATLLFVLSTEEKISTTALSNKDEMQAFIDYLKQAEVPYSYSADDTIGG